MKKTPLKDYEDWRAGNTTSYAGFTVKPKHDMGGWPTQDGCPEPHGWVVTGEHGCNALPGATWSKDRDGALAMIDVYCAVGGQPDHQWALSDEARVVGQRFWHLLRAIQRMTGAI